MIKKDRLSSRQAVYTKPGTCCELHSLCPLFRNIIKSEYKILSKRQGVHSEQKVKECDVPS